VSQPETISQLDVTADAARLAALLLSEDGSRDITSALTGADEIELAGRIRCRESAVLAGTPYAHAVAQLAGCSVAWCERDGVQVAAGEVIGEVSGGATAVLRAERPILNLLQRACGIASLTRRYVEAVAGARCRILHTRKTAPGLRLFDVHAVLAGGGYLHRVGLDRVVMLKDNHWEALDRSGTSLEELMTRARSAGVEAVQVEVEQVAQVETACRAGADRLLIDNQPPDAFRKLAARARSLQPTIELEATGGITLENVAQYAAAGADFISVGALTHSVRAVDLSLEV
jgi:nicotinate-nucleotide pyrophosphorylase (carboxylating)